MRLSIRILLGAVVGLGMSTLLWIGHFTDESLAEFPLDALDAALLTLGGAVAATVHYALRVFAARGSVMDYVIWGVVGAVGGSFLGVNDLIHSGAPAGLIGGATFGVVGGVGARLTVRYLQDRFMR